MAATSRTLRGWRYWWALRIGLAWNNTLEVIGELFHRPLAFAGGVVVLLYILMAIFAPYISPHDPAKGDLRVMLQPPFWQAGGSTEYLLGTDAQGRDILSRIIFGSRVSLAVGVISVSISVLVGVILGAMAGYFRGKIDTTISRFADLLLAWPYLIFAIGVMAFLGPGFVNLIAALTFKGWVEFFRLVRGEMLQETTKEYVESARAVGQGHAEIIRSEILPNVYHSVFVLATLRVGYMIITEASLSFLGLGIQPPTPAWGYMVSEGRNYLFNAWWMSTLPGAAIVGLVLAINLLGEGLRDILDPKLRIE